MSVKQKFVYTFDLSMKLELILFNVILLLSGFRPGIRFCPLLIEHVFFNANVQLKLNFQGFHVLLRKTFCDGSKMILPVVIFYVNHK